jgi:hypothetical protein
MVPMNYAALTTVAAPPDPALALPPVMTGGAANGSA